MAVGGDGWDSAADWSDRAPAPPPPTTRRMVEVICCPGCGSLAVGRKDAAGSTMAYWQCRGCATRWKEPGDIGSERAVIP